MDIPILPESRTDVPEMYFYTKTGAVGCILLDTIQGVSTEELHHLCIVLFKYYEAMHDFPAIGTVLSTPSEIESEAGNNYILEELWMDWGENGAIIFTWFIEPYYKPKKR